MIFDIITLPAAYQAIGREDIGGNFQEVEESVRKVIDIPHEIRKGELDVPLARSAGIIGQDADILIFTHILRTRSAVAKHENSRIYRHG